MNDDYKKREIDMMMAEMNAHLGNQDKKLDKILLQTTEHNHRMTKIEKVLLVMGTVTSVLLIVNGSKFIDFLSSITK